MSRYILIDNHSGYVFGDTASYANGTTFESIEAAARALDESIGEHGRTYSTVDGQVNDNRTGYRVYLGSEALPVVQDGQDADAIESVERCEYLGFVECRRAD